MSDKKISQLTAATTPLAGTEVLPIVQSGATVKVTVDNLTTGKAVPVGSLTATGAISSSVDGSFNSVTIGKGASSLGQNTAVGIETLKVVTTGNANTAFGFRAGNTITTGGSNICLGHTSNLSSATDSNSIVIGVGAVGQGSNTSYIATFSGGFGSVYQGNNSTLWAIISDQRLKKNIVDNTDGLNKITAIQVRNFEYRLPDEIDLELKSTHAVNIQGVQLGAIAQELQTILPDCVKQESTGIYRVDASNLTWYMVNAIKELNAIVHAQAAQILALENKA
jgi:hypothetical protein